MGTYFKDKTEVCKIRLTKEQTEYIENISLLLGCTRSQALRLIIDTVRNGEIANEDKQTDINN